LLHEVLEPLGHRHVEPLVLVDPLPVKVLLPGNAAVNPQVFSLPKSPASIKTAVFSYSLSPIKRSVKTGGEGTLTNIFLLNKLLTAAGVIYEGIVVC